VQEENENMGAWPFYCRKLSGSTLNLRVIARPESGSPATGYMKRHLAQQAEIIDKAFEI